MKKIFFLMMSFSFLISCKNVLQSTANKGTPEAVYYQAKMRLNDRDYTGAIRLLESLGTSFLSRRDVALIYASAHSGRCGLEFVSFVESLSSIGSDSLFPFLMESFVNGTDEKIADCLLSESILAGLGDYTQRLSDENILMGFSSLTKVGTILSRYFDLDGDGIADAGVDHCDETDFPEAQVREIGTGMANAILSISTVASDISSDALSDITSYCDMNVNLNVFCTNTDPASYSANEVRALRQLMGSSDLGVGTCGNFTDLACVCP